MSAKVAITTRADERDGVLGETSVIGAQTGGKKPVLM